MCSTVSRSTTAGEFGGTNGQRLVPTEEDTVAVTQEGYFVPDEAAWNIACSSSPHETRQCPSRDCNLDYKLYPIDRQKSKSVLLMTLDQLRALTEEENCWSFILSSAWEKDQGKNFLQAFFKGKTFEVKYVFIWKDQIICLFATRNAIRAKTHSPSN